MSHPGDEHTPEVDPDPEAGAGAGAEPGGDARGLGLLIDYIRLSRGFDFSGYKTNSLTRRLRKRMAQVGQAGFADYVDYLEVHPEEFALLFNTVLINVTAFFRDPSSWEYLAAEVVPGLVGALAPGDPIRAWSAGCASGEEAYTLVIILAEALGPEAFRERVKIYATDLDEGALSKARLAHYDARELEGVPAVLRAKYFEQVDHRFAFSKEYRRAVIFGRHDLIQDAPISRVDLLVCRNTLMYLNSETQARILGRFHFALNDPGILFLGKAETLLAHSELFTPVDQKRRVFAKVPRENVRDRILALARAGNGDVVNHLVNHVRLREVVFETVPVAQLVVDQNGLLLMANARARALFRLSAGDVGRPLQDLELSYRPVELRSCIDRATLERLPVTVRDVEWTVDAAPCYLDVQVFPLFGGTGATLGSSITFTDVSGAHKLQADLQAAHRELEAAYEELQSANEELETTNEELQSTVEELETTNEELQSSNEELETMNEELQSTNEELHTLNDEMRERSAELDQVNDYLEAILRGMRGGVIVVDRNLLVQIWNHRAEELWGLRSLEVAGKSLMNLDIGLPVGRLGPALKSCLAGETDQVEVEMEATNRRGKALRCLVTCSPLRNATDAVKGVILVTSELEPDAAPPGGGDENGRPTR